MDWCRLWNDVVANPRLMLLPPEVFRTWTLSLCIASSDRTRDGRLPDQAELAFRLRLAPEVVAEHAEALIERGLWTRVRGRLAIAKWDEYQPSSDNAAARKRLQRERKLEQKSQEPATEPPAPATTSPDAPARAANVSQDSRGTCPNQVPPMSRREREKETSEKSLNSPSESSKPSPSSPPNPPGGAVGGLSASPPIPDSALDDEPFIAQPSPATLRIAPVTNIPGEVEGVARWADERVSSWGPQAEAACLHYPVHWVREACSITVAAGKSRWGYVEAILARFRSQGGPDSVRCGKPAPKKSPPLLCDRIHRAPRLAPPQPAKSAGATT